MGALRSLDEFESELLQSCFYLFFLDGFYFLGSEVPLLADKANEDVVMREVYVEVVIVGDKLLPCYTSLLQGQHREKCILNAFQ